MHVVAWPQAGGSTVVVEANAEAIHSNRLENAKANAILAFCRELFGVTLDRVAAPR